jgi:regulator of ribonuclease activity A
VGVPVMISGYLVQPGDWVYADEDGVLISAVALH